LTAAETIGVSRCSQATWAGSMTRRRKRPPS
jgi:hypothetical protein